MRDSWGRSRKRPQPAAEERSGTTQGVVRSSETAEKVDFVGRDPIDAETRRPYGRSPGLRAAAETNLLPRNGPPDSVPDFFSGLVEKRYYGAVDLTATGGEGSEHGSLVDLESTNRELSALGLGP